MIEFLFPNEELHSVTPARMNIGSFITFKEYNPLGIGNQAVHNSGSSMLKDTPSFKRKILGFISEHFKYSNTDNDDVYLFIAKQVGVLNRFKQDLDFRGICLSGIFNNGTYTFKDEINSDYLYTSLILYFVIEYNFLKSTHAEHELTKQKCLEYFSTEADLLKSYFEVLNAQPTITYLSDICYGRYYFLEVHFQQIANPREVPLSIVYEFLLTKNKHIEDFDLNEQKTIQSVKELTEAELTALGDRVPESVILQGSSRYKTNARISKTVLLKANYKCEIDSTHMTFFTKKGILFSEGHHLIPMAFQKDFLPINIDRFENIVSLCPTCHRAVHLGSDDEKKGRLQALYNIKNAGLLNSGINISFEKLLDFYI